MNRYRIKPSTVTFLLLLLPFFALFKISPVAGVDLKDMVSKDKKAPVHITSDNLEADNKAHTIIFSGNVVAKREDATLYADRMVVYLTDKMDTLIKITASGNVRVNQKDRFASGDKGEYYDAEQKVILTGNPKVWQGNNVVTGEVIEFFIKEDKAVARGGESRRVTAVVIPGKGLSFMGSEAASPAAKKEEPPSKEK